MSNITDKIRIKDEFLVISRTGGKNLNAKCSANAQQNAYNSLSVVEQNKEAQLFLSLQLFIFFFNIFMICRSSWCLHDLRGCSSFNDAGSSRVCLDISDITNHKFDFPL